MSRIRMIQYWLLLLVALAGSASQLAAQAVTVNFFDKGTVSTANFRESPAAATPELNPPLLQFTQFNGLGVVGGTADSVLDAGESVFFTFDEPATDVSYYVQFATNINGNSLFGESEVEGYGANGDWLGTVAVDGVGAINISAAFGGQSLTAVRVRPSERIRIYSLGYTPPPLPEMPFNLAGRAKNYKINLTWQASAGATSYRAFRKLDGESVFSDLGPTAYTVFVDNLPVGTVSAQYYVVAENSAGASPPSDTITVVPHFR